VRDPGSPSTTFSAYTSAYDRFIEVLLKTLTERLEDAEDWTGFINGLLEGYLGTLTQDFVVARAFQVEMDAVGAEARARRRAALVRFARFIRSQHERLRERDPTLELLPDQAYHRRGLPGAPGRQRRARRAR